MGNNDANSLNGSTPQRWTAKRKAALVLEIIKDKTTSAEVARLHGLTVAEVDSWIQRAQFGMEEFLKALPKEVEERHSSEKVSSEKVAAPKTVRYAWANNPICNLYNKADLPAVPFRTDNPWTEKK